MGWSVWYMMLAYDRCNFFFRWSLPRQTVVIAFSLRRKISASNERRRRSGK